MQTTVFQKKAALQDCIQAKKTNSETIGFVPTMGALHQGHIALVKKALYENTYVICSIFVNPTQFNNTDDFAKYPSTITDDIALLKESGCHAVFIPEVTEMYPDKTSSNHYNFGGIENEMEGAFRPGHFDGVATIVAKFFDLVKPDNAYFGEKDFQQLLIVKSLAAQFFPSIDVIGCEIVREKSGLALSSRNKRLSNQGKEYAAHISKALEYGQSLVKTERTPSAIVEKVTQQLSSISAIEVEYVSIVDSNFLKKADVLDIKCNLRIFTACWIEGVRLIDNYPLYPEAQS